MLRRSPSGAPLGPEHSISALQAIRYYTSGSAFATRTEGDRGTLRRGSRADFTVLSRSPAGISPEDVGDIRVTMTVVGGAVTYEA
jgi:predicted amidohydrolase YtcJ